MATKKKNIIEAANASATEIATKNILGFEIRNDRPIPSTGRRGRESVYDAVLKQMEIGQYIVVEEPKVQAVRMRAKALDAQLQDSGGYGIVTEQVREGDSDFSPDQKRVRVFRAEPARRTHKAKVEA